MALSGTQTWAVPGCKGYVSIKLTWSASQNIANNTSTVTANAYLVRGTYGAIYAVNASNTLYIDGGLKGGTGAIGGGNNTTTLLNSYTRTLNHNADGTKTFTLKFAQTFNITFGGNWVGTYTTPQITLTLNTIPRQSTFNSVSNANYGSKPQVVLTAHSSSFHHTLNVTANGVSQSFTIPANVSRYDVSFSDTVNNAIYEYLKKKSSCSVSYTLATYNSSNAKIGGTTTKTASITAPQSWAPTIGTAVATESDPTLLGLASSGVNPGFIQNRSNIIFTITGSTASNGSTIDSMYITFNGINVNSGEKTGIVRDSGTLTYTMTVRDTRGLASVKTGTVQVQSVDSPTPIYFNTDRHFAVSNSETGAGTSTSVKTSFLITLDNTAWQYANAAGGTFVTAKLDVTSESTSGNTTTTEWSKSYTATDIGSDNSSGTVHSVGVSDSNTDTSNWVLGTYVFDETAQYEITLTITDIFNNSISLSNIIYPVMPVMALGKNALIIGRNYFDEDQDVKNVYANSYLSDMQNNTSYHDWGGLVLTQDTWADFLMGARIGNTLELFPSRGRSNSEAQGKIILHAPRSDYNYAAYVRSYDDNSFTINDKLNTLGVNFQGNRMNFSGTNAANGYIEPAVASGEVRFTAPFDLSTYIPIRASKFIVNSSSERKSLIHDYDENASIIVENLQIKEYNRMLSKDKSDLEERPEVGIIAEQAPEILLDKDNKAVNTYSYLNVVAKALQEQIKANKDLKEEVSTLKEQVASLTKGLA